MPIFHHTKTHHRFFFIHVPRTAGRFLHKNFIENGYGIEHHLTKEMIEEKDLPNYLFRTPVEGVEISHSHHSLYSKWKNIKGLSSIAVVRNPIDKFFSTSGLISPNIQSSLENWTTYKNFFSKAYPVTSNDWWRPHNNWRHSFQISRFNNSCGKRINADMADRFLSYA